MNYKIKNLLNAIIQQADNAKSNIIVDYETMKEIECKEIKLNLSVKAIEEIRKNIKEFE